MTRSQITAALTRFDEGFTAYDRPSHDRDYTNEELIARLEELAQEKQTSVAELIELANE